jgi:nitrite reductase/ring-hydroxylating ferredoxin subunit
VTTVDAPAPRTVVPAESWAVVNTGLQDGTDVAAVSRRCRHLRADLAEGSVDEDGCLVCPWHQAKYDVHTGRMLRGPQGIFAKVPGLGALFVGLTRIAPLRRAAVTVADGKATVEP